eukprot:SAG11_NODE_3234_length_2594_cov_1.802405_1_plen_248_part_00
MWAVGNALRLHGISTYCALMVRGDNWKEQWFGKLNTAKFAIVMLSDDYWKSGPCTAEVRAILRKGIKVFIVRVDDTCHSCTRGNFLGESVDQITQAGFIKQMLHMNCMPPPHEPLFQEPANFGANAADLAEQILASVPDAADIVPGAGAGAAASPVAPRLPPAVDHEVQEEPEPEPEAPLPLSQWTAERVEAWLSTVLALPAVAVAAGSGGVDGSTAIEADKDDWKELGATGMQASKIVGAIKKLPH